MHSKLTKNLTNILIEEMFFNICLFEPWIVLSNIISFLPFSPPPTCRRLVDLVDNLSTAVANLIFVTYVILF